MNGLLQGIALLVILLTPIIGCLALFAAALKWLSNTGTEWLGGPLLILLFATACFSIWLVIDSRNGAGEFVGWKRAAKQYGRFLKFFGIAWAACAGLALFAYLSSLN